MANILITGCSSGFGYLAALDLARLGERVFATVRDLGRASQLAETAAREGLPLSVHLLDVTDPVSIDRAVMEVAAIGGSIDVLVNNAGYCLRGPLETVSDAEIQKQFDTNVTGVLRMVRAVVPLMRARNSGTIINISSLSGLIGAPYEGVYSASKHAVEAISEVLRFELGPAGIRVLLVAPGAYETGFVGNVFESEAFTADHPLRDEYARFWVAAAGLTGGQRSDPQAVVDAIRMAAIDPDTPFRQLVGDDVQFAVSRKLETGIADFAPTIREMLNLPAAMQKYSPVS